MVSQLIRKNTYTNMNGIWRTNRLHKTRSSSVLHPIPTSAPTPTPTPTLAPTMFAFANKAFRASVRRYVYSHHTSVGRRLSVSVVCRTTCQLSHYECRTNIEICLYISHLTDVGRVSDDANTYQTSIGPIQFLTLWVSADILVTPDTLKSKAGTG